MESTTMTGLVSQYMLVNLLIFGYHRGQDNCFNCAGKGEWKKETAATSVLLSEKQLLFQK